jgi:lipoteichoic acid synthase
MKRVGVCLYKGLMFLSSSREKLAISTDNLITSSKTTINKTLFSQGIGLILLMGREFFFFFSTATVLLKSFLFIGIANNDNTASFNFLKGFHSYQAPPSILVYLAFIIAFLSFSFLIKGRFHVWYLLGFNFLVTLIMVGDLMNYRGFGNFLSPYVISQSSNLENLIGSVLSMLRPVDVLFFLDFVVFFILGKKILHTYKEKRRSVVIFLLLLTLSISSITYRHYQLDIQKTGDDMLFRVAWVPNQTMTNLSPVGYHIYDLYNYYKDNRSYVLKPEEHEEIRQWLTQKEESIPDNELKGLFKGKNLLVLQVESLEDFVINQRVEGQEITPHFNQLLDNSFYFPNVYEQVYNGNSSDADLLVNASVYPVRNGATFFRFPQNTFNSLPKLMKEKGYQTLGIHPDKGAYWNWMQALNSMGFDRTIDASQFDQSEKLGLGISDGSYLSQVAPILINEKQPFYSFMVTLSSHSPFDLPAKFQDLHLKDSLSSSKLGGYFQSIRYTDREIGRFLEELDRNQLLDNTVIVIYGDHTGVHKYYNDEIKQLEPKEQWWLDESKRIPLIIYSKGLEGKKFTVSGGQIDILPTLACLFDLNESYKETALGRNLLNTKKDFVILANKDFIGTFNTESEKEFHIKGIDISDLILRSNYYEAGLK